MYSLEKFLVIVNPGLEIEEIYYCGDVEFEAFKKFMELPYKFKYLVKAKVKMVKVFEYELIQNYEIITKIKG
jgi:hypothetical protein